MDWLNNDLQYRLDIDERLMGSENKSQIKKTIGNLFLAQKDMRSALFNNLRANHKAMRIIVERTETQKLMDQERDSLNSALNKLDQVQTKLMDVMGKDIKDLKMEDLEELKKLMGALPEAMNSFETSGLLARIAEESSDVQWTFIQQLEASKAMMEIFEEALDELKEAPLTEDKNLLEGLDKKLEELEKADTEIAKFRCAISVMSVIIGIVVFAEALLLAFLVMTTPVWMFLTILLGGELLGEAFGSWRDSWDLSLRV